MTPTLNLIVRGLLHAIDDHEEPPQRNPFKWVLDRITGFTELTWSIL